MSNPWDKDPIDKGNAEPWAADPIELSAPPKPDPYADAPVGQGLNKIGRVFVQTLASPAVLASKAAHKIASAAGHGDKVADLGPLLDEQLDKYAPHAGFVEDVAKAAPAFALPGGWIPQVVGNAAIGAVEAPKGEEASGGAKGAAFGTAGKVLSKAVGGLVTPTADAKVLMDRGVALTPGQAAGAGTFTKRAEEWAASNPISGTPIRGAQRRAVEDANIAATQAVANRVNSQVKLGRPPREAIEQTRDLVSKTYDEALEGLTVPGFVPQHQLGQTVGRVAADHPLIEQHQVDQMGRFVNQRLSQIIQNNNGVLDGPMLKQIDSEIGQQIRNLRSSTNAADKTAAPAWADLQQSIREVMEFAQASPEKSAQLKAANAAYRELLALEKSLLPGAQSFTPRQLQRSLDKAKIDNAELRTVSNAMERTLPNTVPDSGTAERLIANSLPALLIGGGAGANELGWGTVGSGMIAAGALGSRPGARFVTGGLPGQAMLSAALRRTTPATLHAANRKDEKK